MKIRNRTHNNVLINFHINTNTLKHFQIKPETCILWTPFILSICYYLFLFYSPFFSLTNIQCQYNHTNCPEEINVELNKYLHKPSLTFNPISIQKVFANTYPDFRTVQIDIQLPHSLFVSIQTLNHQTLLRVSNQSAALKVSPEYKIIDQTIDINDSYIITPKATKFRIGEIITENDVKFAIDLALSLAQQNITFQYIDIQNPQEIVVYLHDNKIIITTSLKDLVQQVTTLQLILAKDTMTPEYPILDVRHQKAVLMSTFPTASSSATINN